MLQIVLHVGKILAFEMRIVAVAYNLAERLLYLLITEARRKTLCAQIHL